MNNLECISHNFTKEMRVLITTVHCVSPDKTSNTQM